MAAIVVESVQLNHHDDPSRCWKCHGFLRQGNRTGACWVHPKPPQTRPKPKAVLLAISARSEKLSRRRFQSMQIVNATARFFGIDPQGMMKKIRRECIKVPQQIACYLIIEDVEGSTFWWTGYQFFERHHTVVMYSHKIVKACMAGGDGLKAVTVRKAVDAIRALAPQMPGDHFVSFDDWQKRAYEALAVIGKLWNLTPEQLLERKRKRPVPYVKNIAGFVLKVTGVCSFPQLENLFGSTISESARRRCWVIKRAIAKNPNMRKDVERATSAVLALQAGQ